MSKKITTEEFKEKILELYGGKYEVVSGYVNNCTKILLKCNECGNFFKKAPVKMTGTSKEGCYFCSKKNRYKTKNTLQKEIDEKYPDGYEILGEYINSRTPIPVVAKKCGHEYMISPDNLLRGKGCPRCSIKQSSYMNIVEKYLDDNKISYEKEKIFDDCKNIRPLPFDYFLPKLGICIEVDGEFHFQNNSTLASKNKRTQYEEVRRRDEIKNKYCDGNGIKLIRLPYFEKKNFSKILNQELQVDTEITT